MGLFIIVKSIVHLTFCKYVSVVYFFLLHITFKVKPYQQICVRFLFDQMNIYFLRDTKVVQIKGTTFEFLADRLPVGYAFNFLIFFNCFQSSIKHKLWICFYFLCTHAFLSNVFFKQSLI